MPDPGPRVLVVAPDRPGGVDSAVDALLPHLPGVRRVGTRPAARAAAAILRHPADVVWLHPSLRRRAVIRDTLLGGIAVARGRGVAVQVHGWDPAVARSLGPRLGSIAGRRVGAWGVLLQEHAEELARFGIPADRIHRVRNAYRPEVVPDRPAPIDPPTVLFVGRLVAAKGPGLLLEAARDLPGIRVRFAGDGPARPALAHAAVRWRLAERVALDGWLDPPALRRAYAEASVVVLPSAAESYPLAVVEALAAGIPVVATAVGAVPELVSGAGRIVQPTPAAIAGAVRDLLANPPPIAAARERIRALCAPEAVAARWRELLGRVA